MGRDSETEKTIQKKKLLSLAPIANPLAGKKLCKRTHKLVRRATEAKCVRRGVKEVVKSIRRGHKGLCVIAGNISPIEKNVEKILFKTKKRKIKMNKTFDEAIGVSESPEFEEGSKIQKGKDGERISNKTKKRKIKENRTFEKSIGSCESPSEFAKGPKTQNGQRSKDDSWESSIQSKTLNETDIFIEPETTSNVLKTNARKLKKNCKHKKKHLTSVKEVNIEEVQRVIDQEKVDEISSVDDDCTRGMKKWLIRYKESRLGLEVLQQRIDEFVTAHEERQEQERKEREARAAEDGWTVVVHQKGRKKTTDVETGTVVGSVASAAVMDKKSKKKSKEIALDFYRFQKREAKRNEVMMLQSKFEQDKKRIQQLRAARKFRPS